MVTQSLAANLWKDEFGATSVEYGMMVALIAVASLLIISTLGKAIRDKLFYAAVSGMPW